MKEKAGSVDRIVKIFDASLSEIQNLYLGV